MRAIDPEVKTIVSSGYSNDPSAVPFMRHRFSDFIAKPYKLEDLGEILQRVLSRDH